MFGLLHYGHTNILRRAREYYAHDYNDILGVEKAVERYESKREFVYGMWRGYMDIDALIKQENHIVIYGMGHVAQKLYRILDKKNMRDRILCFAVTNKSHHLSEYQGIPVTSIFDIDCLTETLVCIAVHEVNKNEIEDILIRRGCRNYIWITPQLIPFAFGVPIMCGKKISVNELVRLQGEKCYWFAARYLAIEQYLGKNNCGYAIYEKVQMVHCSLNTAQKRLLQFQRLIEAYLTKRCEFSIAIDSVGRILDGAHRTTVYSYWNESRIVADIYAASEDYYEILGATTVFLDDEILKNHGFTPSEMDMLENMRKEIWSKVT